MKTSNTFHQFLVSHVHTDDVGSDKNSSQLSFFCSRYWFKILFTWCNLSGCKNSKLKIKSSF